MVNGGGIIKRASKNHIDIMDILPRSFSQNNGSTLGQTSLQVLNYLFSATGAVPVVSPEMLLQQILDSIHDGTYYEALKKISISSLINYIKHYYEQYKKDTNDTHNLELAKACANLIYLIDPNYKNDNFNNLANSVTHSWLEYIPRSIQAARPIKAIPGEVIKKFAIPVAKPISDDQSVIELPSSSPSAKAIPVQKAELEFNEEDLKKAKYEYNLAEFCFVMREYE